MGHFDKTYRYGIIIHGISYSPGYPDNPAHVIMAETLSDVRRILSNARYNYPAPYDETGEGKRVLDTPAYGEPGDGATIYRVERDDPQFGEVLDMPGSRARHAYAWMNHEPIAMFTFGPRGGLRMERF